LFAFSLSMEFFRRLVEADEATRREATKSIIGMLLDSLNSSNHDLIKSHLPTIVRLSAEVPFDDLIVAFSEFLSEICQRLKDIDIPSISPPSNFLPEELFPPVNSKDEHLHQLFVDIFLLTGRVNHLNRMMVLHTSYFEKYYEAFNFIMREPGPLPLDWRNYIAILAASRFRCKYLVSFQEVEFLYNGGQVSWLRGLENLPKKLASLLDIVQILCHQPWLISKEHISTLVKADDSWSIGELVHAMIIICTFKALSGIVYGCGVTPEVDLDFRHEYTANSLELESREDLKEENDKDNYVDDTEKLMKLLQEGWQVDEEPKEQQEMLFVNAEETNLSCKSSSLKVISECSRNSDFQDFLSKYPMQHEDFDVKSKNYGIFRVQDYCWKEDGFELASRFLPGLATMLDNEFDHIYNMTYKKFNEKENVNTFPFRQAVWQYVQRVKGIFYDDYNYQEVNIFLNRSTKNYIKKIICYPQLVTRSDFNNIGIQLRPDEKVHVALLAVESSKQSELLYGLHAVLKYMYNS